MANSCASPMCRRNAWPPTASSSWPAMPSAVRCCGKADATSFSSIAPGGCLAVEFTTTGQVAHAYPFRNDELEQAAADAQSDEFPYELSPAASFRDVDVIGISRYANGDLLAVFHQDAAFPYGAGVARVDRDGHPVWFRARLQPSLAAYRKTTASRWCPACWPAASP